MACLFGSYRKASRPQPPPAGNGKIVYTEVLKDIKERVQAGKQKYGTNLKTNNGREALWDAYQEAIDLVMYLKQALMENENENE